MKLARSLQCSAWHRAIEFEFRILEGTEAIDFNSAPQPRGDQSQERSSSLKSSEDLPRRALGRAVSPRMTVAYRSQYPAAQTGELPEEKQPGRQTKKCGRRHR
jgi:hypothetical protein